MKPLSHVAGAWRAKGQHVVPVVDKRPHFSIYEWQSPTVADAIPLDFFDGNGVTGCGLLTGFGYVDVDFDDTPTEYFDLLPQSRVFGRGGAIRHSLYACPDGHTKKFRDPKTGKMIVEVRARGCQTVMPGSMHVASGQPIEWIGKDSIRAISGAHLEKYVTEMVDAILLDRHGELEVRALRRQQAADALVERPAFVDVSVMDRASAYLTKMDPSISGQGGHLALWRAAATLVRRFALPPHAALDLLGREFNPRCQPQWSAKELQHKVTDAIEAASFPLGDLLAAPLRRRAA